MKTVRLSARLLFYLSRIASIIVLVVSLYAVAVILLSLNNQSALLPIEVSEDGIFRIFYPFTKKVFLLGDYTSSYLVSNLLIITFYGVFMWLLSDVFHAFKQRRLFTRKGV